MVSALQLMTLLYDGFLPWVNYKWTDPGTGFKQNWREKIASSCPIVCVHRPLPQLARPFALASVTLAKALSKLGD